MDAREFTKDAVEADFGVDAMKSLPRSMSREAVKMSCIQALREARTAGKPIDRRLFITRHLSNLYVAPDLSDEQVDCGVEAGQADRRDRPRSGTAKIAGPRRDPSASR